MNPYKASTAQLLSSAVAMVSDARARDAVAQLFGPRLGTLRQLVVKSWSIPLLYRSHAHTSHWPAEARGILGSEYLAII